MTEKIKINKWEEKYIIGAKRANIIESECLNDWFVGFGKDESCQFEGTWWDMICFARNILASPNTKQCAPEFYHPELQNDNYYGEEIPYEYVGDELPMTDKYIKASECEKYFYGHLDDLHMIAAMNAIDEMPNADVVEVVRCKDCKHYDDEFNLCILRSEAPDPNPNSDFCGCEFTTHINDFCSWGKRKENYNG